MEKLDTNKKITKKERDEKIKERARFGLNLLKSKAKGIEVREAVDEGSQCDIVLGPIDIYHLHRAVLEEMVLSLAAYKKMIKEGGNYLQINNYRQGVKDVVHKQRRKKLIDIVDNHVCKNFFGRSSKKSKLGMPIYVPILRVYKLPEREDMLDPITKQLRRERRIAGFPNTNVIYVACNIGTITFMEHFPHISLEKMKKLTVGQCIKVGIDILNGLDGMHAIGVFHRDIKPENIFVHLTRYLKKPIAKLGDLGNIVYDTSLGDSDLTKTEIDGKIFGTFAYLPLDQLHFPKLYDERGDIMGAAASLYWMVTGGEIPNQPPKKEVEKDRHVALMRNVNLMSSNNPKKHHKPVSPLRLRSSYREVLKETRNPIIEYIYNPLTRKRRVRNLAETLRNFVMVLAGAMNPDCERRYKPKIEKVEDANGKVYDRKVSATERMRRDLEFILRREKPKEVYEVVGDLRTDMGSYVDETFTNKNQAFSSDKYIYVPRSLRKW